MKNKYHPNIECGSWDEFKKDVKSVNSQLYKAIEIFDPEPSLKILKVKYYYGQHVTDMGKICLPINSDIDQVINIDHADFPDEFKDQLSYAPTPLILQMHNKNEVFVDHETYTSPLNVFNPGDLYGLFETIVPLTGAPFTPAWSVTSGARSAFMLPKVTSQRGVLALNREYGVSTSSSANQHDHWHIFKAISSRQEDPWFSEVIIFTKDWFKKRDDNLGWMTFYNYLLEQAWVQSKNIRLSTEFTSSWVNYAKQIEGSKIKINPYIIDTVLHCLKISSGYTPGYIPINNEIDILPSRCIEEAYTNTYKNLGDLAPIVIGPTNYDSNMGYSVYYSLSSPTLSSPSPFIRQLRSFVTESIEIQQVVTIINQCINQENKHLAENKCFYTVYNDSISISEILSTSELLCKFPFENIMDRFQGKEFPLNGKFMKSVIEISS